MLKKTALAGTALILLPACASIDRGINDHVRVDTVPQGATVSVRHIPLKDSVRQPGAIESATCEATPCAFEVRRSQRGIVLIEKDGFETAEYYIINDPTKYGTEQPMQTFL